MPAPTAPSGATTTTTAPRIDLEEELGTFDLGYGADNFEYRFPQPPTSREKKESRRSVDASMPSATEAKTNGERQSKFVEVMSTPIQEPRTDRQSADGSVRTSWLSDNDVERAYESPAQNGVNMAPSISNHVVNPATIPMRTSSSKAVNGERHRDGKRGDYMDATPPKKSPRKHRSLGAVPEERRYSSKPDTNGYRYGNGTDPMEGSSSHARNFTAPNTHSRYASSTSSQQTALNAAGPSTSRQTSAEPFRSLVASDLITVDPATNWSHEKENILKGPYDYLESHPGKDIRAQLIAAFNAWLRVPTESLTIITKVVAMLHTASLLIDDVEDSSSLRRGVPVAHHIFGAAQTINSANYIYFCALQELLKLNNPEAIQIYTDELLNLHRGQGMDLFWRDTLTCPSEDDYLEMVGNKTGGLFRLAIKLMCAESPSHSYPLNPNPATPNARTDYVPLVNTIGLLFQILDDYRNLSDEKYTANKGLCEDLTEGKFSFPIIHSIRSDPSSLVLINILKQKTDNDEVKRYAMQYMEKTGSFAYTRRVLRGLTKKALQLVEEVEEGVGPVGGEGGGEGMRLILEKMRVDRPARSSGGGTVK